MDLGPHAAFIVSAYACAVVVIVALIVWITLDYRRTTRALTDLEKRGVTRRASRRETS